MMYILEIYLSERRLKIMDFIYFSINKAPNSVCNAPKN